MAVEAVEIVLNGVDNASPVVDKVSQKLVASEEKYLSKLKEQFIAQTQGAEAAERFKLAEMGFSEATIESALALKQQIEAAKEAAKAAEELAKQTQEAANTQQELQAGPTLSDSATEFASSMGEGLSRARGIAESVKPVVEYLTGSAGWQMKMNRLMDEHQQQVDFNLKKQQDQLGIQIQIANLQTDRVVREEMLKAQQSEVNAKLKEQQQLVDQMRRTQEESADSFGGRMNALAEGVTGGLYNNNEDQAIVENILKEEEKRLAALQQQKEQLDQQLQVENEQLRLAREKAEAEQRRADNAKSAEEELNKLRNEIRELNNPGENERRRVNEMFDAEGVTEAQRMELENLRAIKLEEEEIARQKKEAAEQNKKDIQDIAAEQKRRLDELVKGFEDADKRNQDQVKKNADYLASLKLQTVELTEGKRAAAELKAEMSGVSKEVIAQGRETVIQNELLEAQNQLKEEQKKQDDELAKKLATPAPQLQAMQSRLLTRSGQSNLGERQAKANEKVADLTEKIEGLQREHQKLLEEIRTNTRNQILVVN